jgi:hypothetical protein
MPVNLSTDSQLTRPLFPNRNPYTKFLSPPEHDKNNELFFINEAWQIGLHDEEVLKTGTEIIIYMPSLQHGWQRRRNGDVVESALVTVESEQAAPRRADLGDRDESLWNIGKFGQPQDPWERVVLFCCSIIGDGRLLSFTANTSSGRDTIAPVCKEYGHIIDDHPELRPIVELDCWDDPNNWSSNFMPRFRLTGWDSAWSLADDGTPLPKAEAPGSPAPKKGKAA